MFGTLAPFSVGATTLGRHRGACSDQSTSDALESQPGGRHRRDTSRTRRRTMATAALTAALLAGPGLTSAAEARTYTVRSGDTLAKIAQRHGTDWRTLYNLNRRVISDPSRIFVGQRLELDRTRHRHATQRPRATVAKASNSSFVQRVFAEARRVEGVPYRYGGTSPSTGFDCSGFTSYVFRRAGKIIPRTSGAQAAASRRVSAASLRPGDLVFFRPSGRVSHVAIYAGRGMVWEAPGTGGRVRLAPMWKVSRFYGRM
jgi:cell wall-associated NlpC family hydrolase